jgi:hypothetical protein
MSDSVTIVVETWGMTCRKTGTDAHLGWQDGLGKVDYEYVSDMLRVTTGDNQTKRESEKKRKTRVMYWLYLPPTGLVPLKGDEDETDQILTSDDSFRERGDD